MITISGNTIYWGDKAIAQIPEDATSEAGNMVAAANAQICYLGKTPGFKVPNLDNATPSFLTDLLGQANKRRKALKKAEGWLKEALKGRSGFGEVKGEYYDARISQRERTGISKDLLEKHYPEVAADADIKSTTEFTQVDVKSKAEDGYPVDDFSDIED